MDLERELVAHLLPVHPNVDYEADEIADAIYSQSEPWRSRFLRLAAQGVRMNSNGRVPERDEVSMWLRQSLSLRQQMGALLLSWNGLRGLAPEKDVCTQT